MKRKAKMTGVLYKYAFDESNKLVCIDDYDKVFDLKHSYKCPNCGATMIAKPGNGGKTPHFAHKDVGECSGETYLHKLGKIILLRRWYDKSKDFTIKYNQKSFCILKDTCPLYEEKICTSNVILSYNIKDVYDECYEEKKIDGFVADILITSKKYSDKPIMVEIWVSHECSEKKQASKNKIIEIKLDSIYDVLSLEKGDIVESDKIHYTGTFERNSKQRLQMTRDYIQHFKLFRNSGKVHCEPCTCQHIPHKSSNTLFECLISSYAYDMGIPINIRKICLAKAKECGAVDKLCSNCTFYKYNDRYNRNICVIYKKYNLPIDPKPIFAINCPYYRADTLTSSWGVTHDDEDLINAKIMVL